VLEREVMKVGAVASPRASEACQWDERGQQEKGSPCQSLTVAHTSVLRGEEYAAYRGQA